MRGGRTATRSVGVRLSGAAVLVAASASPAVAVDPGILASETGPYVHYSYSALFGSGIYELEDRSVTALRVVPALRLREAAPRQPGLRLIMPVTAAWHEFTFGDLGDLLEEPAATLTVLPGVEFEYPVGTRGRIRPSLYAGAGFDFTNDETNFVYGAALRGRYRVGDADGPHALGGELLVAGHVPTDGESKFIPRAGVGLDLVFPTGRRLGKGELFFNAQLVAYGYLNELTFETLGPDDIAVDFEAQAGVAIGRDPPFRILGFELERIGIGYRRSAAIEGVVLLFGFPF